MNKRIIPAFLILFLTAGVCFAQVRNADYDYNGKTNLGNLGLQGSDTTGTPAYIEMKAVHPDGTDEILYYLWVHVNSDGTGDLQMASGVVMRALASFPTGDWTSGVANTTGAGKVSAQ